MSSGVVSYVKVDYSSVNNIHYDPPNTATDLDDSCLIVHSNDTETVKEGYQGVASNPNSRIHDAYHTHCPPLTRFLLSLYIYSLLGSRYPNQDQIEYVVVQIRL